MNVKLNINDISSMLGRITAKEMHRQLYPLGKQVGVLFLEPQIGSGYMQWDFEGEGWISFGEADDQAKHAIATMLDDRKRAMVQKTGNQALVESVFSQPSTDYIYFRRQEGNNIEIALAAWGYKFYGSEPSRELENWIVKKHLQLVDIGFSWDAKPLRNFNFNLEGHKRITGEDALFHFDNPVPVGDSYRVETPAGKVFSLEVEDGRQEYVYELAQYFNVEITVTKDGQPLANSNCTVGFGTYSQPVATDENGRCTLRIAMEPGQDGAPVDPQPECSVACGGERQQQAPATSEQTLPFHFDFSTPPPPPEPEPEPQPEPEPEPEPDPEPEEPKLVHVQLLDYGGYPLPNMPFKLTLKRKGTLELVTDDEGYYTLPAEYFTNNERMKIEFTVTKEYQQQHDIHEHEKKKKNK